MPTMLPYRLQIFLPPETRQALKDAAHRHNTSLQQLVEAWLNECLERDQADDPPQAQERARRQAVSASAH